MNPRLRLIPAVFTLYIPFSKYPTATIALCSSKAFVSSKEQAGFISHSAAGLVEELYYGGDKTGLEVLVKNLELIAGHAKDCLDCLELIGKE